MSIMPLTKEFGNAATYPVAGDPTLWQRLAAAPHIARSETEAAADKNDEAERNRRFNNQNTPEINRMLESSNARQNKNGDAAHILKSQQRYQQFASSINMQTQWGSGITNLLGRLAPSFTIQDVQTSFHEEKIRQWDKHVQAAKAIPVSADKVAIDPRTGLPMTKEQYIHAQNLNASCGGKMTAEQLAADGTHFMMDAQGEHYYDRRAQEISDAALNEAQTLDDIIQNKTPYEELSPEQQLIVLQNRTPDERHKIYETHQVSDAERGELEHAIAERALQNAPGALGAISDPETAADYGDVTINDGAIKGGEFDIEGLHASFKGAAIGMLPASAQFATPISGITTSISLQKQMELTPGM